MFCKSRRTKKVVDYSWYSLNEARGKKRSVLSDTSTEPVAHYLHARMISDRGNSNYRRDELHPKTFPTLNLVLVRRRAKKYFPARRINSRWRSSLFAALSRSRCFRPPVELKAESRRLLLKLSAIHVTPAFLPGNLRTLRMILASPRCNTKRPLIPGSGRRRSLSRILHPGGEEETGSVACVSRAIKLSLDRAPDTREHFNRVISFSPFFSRLRVHESMHHERSRNSDIWRVLLRRYARVRAGEKFTVKSATIKSSGISRRGRISEGFNADIKKQKSLIEYFFPQKLHCES